MALISLLLLFGVSSRTGLQWINNRRVAGEMVAKWAGKVEKELIDGGSIDADLGYDALYSPYTPIRTYWNWAVEPGIGFWRGSDKVLDWPPHSPPQGLRAALISG